MKAIKQAIARCKKIEKHVAWLSTHDSAEYQYTMEPFENINFKNKSICRIRSLCWPFKRRNIIVL